MRIGNTNVTSPGTSKPNVIVAPKLASMTGEVHFTAAEMQSFYDDAPSTNVQPSRVWESRWKPLLETPTFESVLVGQNTVTKVKGSRARKK